MWQLLIPLVLWLDSVGVGRAELTGVQRKALQVALEEFHKHPPVQWAFQETSVDSAADTVSGMALVWLGGGGLHLWGTCAFPGSFSGEGHQPRSHSGARLPTQLSIGLSVCLSAALPRGHLCEVGI